MLNLPVTSYDTRTAFTLAHWLSKYTQARWTGQIQAPLCATPGFATIYSRGFSHRHISSTVDQNVYFTQFLLAVITWVISSQKQRSDKSQYCRCKLGQSLWAQTKLCSEVPIICWRTNTIMWRHRAEMEPSNTCIASTVTRMLLKESQRFENSTYLYQNLQHYTSRLNAFLPFTK